MKTPHWKNRVIRRVRRNRWGITQGPVDRSVERNHRKEGHQPSTPAPEPDFPFTVVVRGEGAKALLAEEWPELIKEGEATHLPDGGLRIDVGGQPAFWAGPRFLDQEINPEGTNPNDVLPV